MFNELNLKIEEYLGKGANFAVAQVIDRIGPTSGKVGDKALILETGELIGWIGGGCVRGIVIKEALEVIRTKRYRRVRISPKGGTSESANFKQYVMSCQSEGTVEVLIEAVIPQPEMLIVGKSNIARKLASLAAAADFKVTVMGRDADAQTLTGSSAVVVGDPYVLTVHVPPGFRLAEAIVEGEKAEVVNREVAAAIRVVPSATKTVSWEIKFQ